MATLRIYSDIQTEGEKQFARMFGDIEGVSFNDVNAFCDAIPEKDGKIDVCLHCDGGSVLEGWAIYDRLRATGKEITCTVEGNAASMATVILMAAPKERRRAYENAHILIHNPWTIPMNEPTTASDAQALADQLRCEQERILDLYAERTGASREELQALMDKDEYIDAKRAQELGLIGEILPPLSAKSNVSFYPFIMQKKSLMSKMLAKLGFKSEAEAAEALKGMDLNTADGGVLTVEREEGEPQVGDKASPDGEFVMPDGNVIVVEGGEIVEIKPAPAEEAKAEAEGEEPTEGDVEEAADEAADTIAELTEQLEEATAELQEVKEELVEARAKAKTPEEMRILNAVAMAGGIAALQGKKSGYKPAGRKMNSKAVDQATAINQRFNELRKK